MTSVSSLSYLLNFCLVDLSIVENGVLKSPFISVWNLMCELSFSNVAHICVLLNLGHRYLGL